MIEEPRGLEAGGGIAALVVGTYIAVMATESTAKALGLSRITGGRFVTTPVAMMPEIVAMW